MKSRLGVDEVAVVRERFTGAWRGAGGRCVPDFAEIVERYSEPHRAYHTLEHVLACLRWLEASRELAERPFEVELALIYHDVVYDPFRGDSELQSADLFRAHAVAVQLESACTERIVDLIAGTASHRACRGDAALVNDIDLAVFGSSPLVFARYEQQIRREYQHVDDALFRSGRASVLGAFLDSPSIYSTALFSQRLETRARMNLSRSLWKLQKGPGGRAR